MKTLMRRTAHIVAAGAFFVCALSMGSASAHSTAEATTPVTTSTAQAASDTYKFTAEKGNSLTKIVRRAIQLYQEDKKITLSPAAAVYGETTIVQAMGAGDLEVGQHVDVPSALLQSAVDSSKTLTAAQLSKWEQYSKNVSFDVSYIKAEKPAPVASSDAQDEEETLSTEEANAEEDAESKNEDSKTPSAYWWFIGVGALVALYFVLGGPSISLRKH